MHLPTVILRNYEPQDLDAICLLEKRAFEVGPYTRRMLKSIFHSPKAFNLVAEENGRIVGYVVAFPLNRNKADIETIAVDPIFHRQGTGTILLSGIENEMRKRGFEFSVLEVRSTNSEAINFYIKHGYRTVEHIHQYYTEVFRGSRGAYRMEKML